MWQKRFHGTEVYLGFVVQIFISPKRPFDINHFFDRTVFWFNWFQLSCSLERTWFIIATLFTSHCLYLNADKSTQLCGAQRLGFSCRAKVRVGRVGGGQGQHGNFCCFCHTTDYRRIKRTATIAPSAHYPTAPSVLPWCSVHDQWLVITFMQQMQPGQDKPVMFGRGEACLCTVGPLLQNSWQLGSDLIW